jgi:hypothetical protein
VPTPEPTPRPRIVGPLLVALVFLAVIGASVGFVLGNRGDDPQNTGADRNTGEDIGDPFTPSPSPSPSPSPTAVVCPASTQQKAGKDLTGLLYVRTGRSEVWICVDADEKLYYQGHSGPPGEELVNDVNAIFLTDVEATQYGYRARNTKGGSVTVYSVSSKELIIQTPDGTRATEPAVNL